MTSKLREPINSITHLAGAVLSLIALIAMLIKAAFNDLTALSILSVCIFGICLILLYTVSGTYHGLICNEKIINFFQKLDHSMIFVLIAGSYAPFCLISLKNSIGKPMIIIMFTIAIIGIIFKLCWFNCPRWLQTSLYIGMGWAAIFIVKPLAAVTPAMSIFWLVLGGIFYTIGGIIYGAKPKNLKIGKFEFHEIFHIFIILGSLSHFISVFVYII